MPLTIDEILQCEERLQAEIAERECLLAAVKVMRGYAEKGRSLKGLELGALGQALLAPGANKTLTLGAPAENSSNDRVAAPAPVSKPVEPPYMNSELKELKERSGTNVALVTWAIGRMTDDFSLRDIAALLAREGCRLKRVKISVVLTRLKTRGQIIEIGRGLGRKGSTFRKPEPATAAIDGQ